MNTPNNVQAWLNAAPRNCHTCEHYYGDQCYIHKASPPPEFAEADNNECGEWTLGYFKMPF